MNKKDEKILQKKLCKKKVVRHNLTNRKKRGLRKESRHAKEDKGR